MLPTFDFMNLVRRVVKLALKSVTSRVASALAFATTVVSLVSAFGFNDLVLYYIPHFPELTQMFSGLNINSSLVQAMGYIVAGDYAVILISNLLDFINFLIVQLPVFLISFLAAIWGIQVLRGTRKDINDVVT